MRRLISDFLWLWISLLSLGAGEAESAPKEPEDDGDFFEGDDDHGDDDADDKDDEEEDTAESDDDDSEEDDSDEDDDEDDEEDDDDAESDDDDADESGEGGDEGVDSVAAMSIRRNWETRFEAMGRPKAADPMASLRSAATPISDELRERVTKMFEDEKDIEAIIEVVRDAVPAMLTAYDEGRVAPVVDAATITSRNQRLLDAVDNFDEEYPGVRESRNEQMAELYNEFKEKYGYQYADSIPVEDYFIMAGGQLPAKQAKAQPKRSKAKQRAEAEKRKAVKATRQPERISRGRKRGKRSSRSQRDVDDTYDAVQRTHFQPFTMD